MLVLWFSYIFNCEYSKCVLLQSLRSELSHADPHAAIWPIAANLLALSKEGNSCTAAQKYQGDKGEMKYINRLTEVRWGLGLF